MSKLKPPSKILLPRPVLARTSCILAHDQYTRHAVLDLSFHQGRIVCDCGRGMAVTTAPCGKHRLKLKGVIGQGAFGVLHKGLLDGCVVAVKTIPHGEEHAMDSKMFFREAQIMRACEHRRIIGYIALLSMPATDKKSKEPTYALVMEYAQNGNLTQRIAQQMIQPGSKQYGNTQAIQWALDVASALEYLHMRTPAVLHRDVKSANIMLTSEDGCLVAKLSDFGLHVAADDSKYQALQTSSQTAMAGSKTSMGAAAAAACTTVLVGTALSPSSHSRASTTPDTTGGQAAASSNGTAGAQQDQLQQQQQLSGHGTAAVTRLAAEEHQVYSEVHDSCGSRVYLDTHDSAKATTQQAGPGETRQKQPPKKRSSFRRAAHHPAGEALPRVSGVGEASAAADMQAAADANASLFAQWRSDSSSMGGSMCSLVSAGTWTTGGTGISGTDTAGSDCTEDTCGSIYEELETVFNMTGRTGSCLYMAPEVFLNHSYNEKSDVFSFGVVLYELMARTLVVFTELPTNSNDSDLPEQYAQKVADGYRPSRPKSMPDTMWALITACWHKDPLLRPHMTEVVAVLSAALDAELTAQVASRKSRPSFGFSRKPAPGQLQPVAAATAGAAATSTVGTGAPSGRAGSPLESMGEGGPGCEVHELQEPGAVGAEGAQPAPTASSQGCSCVIC